MAAESYPAARAIAPVVAAHFAAHAAAARPERGRVASPPDAAVVEALISAAFWASLRREEGYVPRISLAYVAPGETPHPLLFERPLPLAPAALTKVSPAVERAGMHLGVWPDGADLSVWGTTRTVPPLAFVLEVASPGLLVVKHQRGGDLGKFVNVAVLEGDTAKVVDEAASSLPGCPRLLTSLLGFGSPASWVDGVNVLVQLAVSMRAHRRGGLMLVVPARSDAWRESIVQPIPYGVAPPFLELARLVRETPEPDGRLSWQGALARAVDAVAGLTAVDGATVLTLDYELLAFGAKIARRRGSPPVERISVTEPIIGGAADVVHPTYLGGTRHLSAAQFVQDQHDAMALVASQDGRFTVFAWSHGEHMVHAHRVEMLLL
ncbi:MAG: putative sensor domain DACNV-containing protein [Betaproteobacteria bacterium]